MEMFKNDVKVAVFLHVQCYNNISFGDIDIADFPYFPKLAKIEKSEIGVLNTCYVFVLKIVACF